MGAVGASALGAGVVAAAGTNLGATAGCDSFHAAGIFGAAMIDSGAGAGASTEKDTEHAPASDADSPDDPGDAAPPADDAGTDDALPGNDAGPDDASPAAQ